MNRTYQMERVTTAMDAVARRCPRRGLRLALSTPPRSPIWHDVWHLRWQWDDLEPRLRGELGNGTFRLEPARAVRLEVRSSHDAPALKQDIHDELQKTDNALSHPSIKRGMN